MRDPIRVLVLGTGQMGSGVARLVLEKKGLELAGAFARRAERDGLDVGRAIGLGHELGFRVATDLRTAIDHARPDVAIQTTCSTVQDAIDEIRTLVSRGIHVISIAEELACPAQRSPRAAAELERLAVASGVAIVGTGINPGFVFDTLIVTLTSVCATVESISAIRVNDLSAYGPTVLASQGVGLTAEAFREGLRDGTVVGHIGFPESIGLIAGALGWEIDQIEERREPILSQVLRQTPFVTVEPGRVAGCLHSAVAYRQGAAVITLEHPQQVLPALAGVRTSDTIRINGTPDIELVGTPELPGGTGTVAIAVNAIPRLLNAAPGLHTMLDLPPCGAILGDARGLVH